MIQKPENYPVFESIAIQMSKWNEYVENGYIATIRSEGWRIVNRPSEKMVYIFRLVFGDINHPDYVEWVKENPKYYK